MAAAEEAAAVGALLAARAGAMSRENHQPTEPLHPRCSAHCDRAARSAAAAQPPPGTHSLARRPGRRRTGRTRGRRRRREKRGETRRKGEGGVGFVLAEEGEERKGGGSPALKGVCQRRKPPKIKSYFSSSICSGVFLLGTDRVPALGKKVEETRRGEKPKRRVSVRGGTAWFPPHRWLRKLQRRSRRLPGPGQSRV